MIHRIHSIVSATRAHAQAPATLAASLTLVMALAACGSTSHSARMGVFEGNRRVLELACEGLHGSGKQALVQTCLNENLTSAETDDARIAEVGDDDDKRCYELGGVVRKKMPACASALTQMMRGDAQSDESMFLHGWADMVKACAADELCAEPTS